MNQAGCKTDHKYDFGKKRKKGIIHGIELKSIHHFFTGRGKEQIEYKKNVE